MKRICIITLIFLAASLVYGVRYYVPSCEPDGKVNGTKWKDWIVLPGEAIEHSVEYFFYNDVKFNMRFIDEYSVAIRVPSSEEASDKGKYWQICFGSWEDPYSLSACVNIPVYQNDLEYRLTAQSSDDKAWSCGFLYVVLYQSSDGEPYNGDNSIVENSVCKTKDEMQDLIPQFKYNNAVMDIPYLFLHAVRIKPEDEPNRDYFDATIPEKPKYVTATLSSMSEVSVPHIRVIVSYKFPDCDSVQTHFTEVSGLNKQNKVKTPEIGPFNWIKPVSQFSYRYGEYSLELIPYWKNPIGTDCEVIHPFPYYINGSAEGMKFDMVGTFYPADEADE